MAIRTQEELIDKIAHDHVWRKREISEFKTLVSMQTTSAHRKTVLCRSGTALLYAHWEGFVKKSGTYFLEYVSNQRLTIAELKCNFVAIIVKGKFEKASASKKQSAFNDTVDYIIKNRNTRARIPFKNIIDTQSNLSSNVLEEILWCLGLEGAEFSTKKNLIDKKLVSRRNHIAHGEYIDINADDFVDLAENVLELLNIFRNLLENSAATNLYKT
jgi:hypothetical protein